MRLRDRVRAHPRWSLAISLVASVATVLTGAALIEAVWSLISDRPLVPVIGDWLRESAETVIQVLLIVGFLAVVLWTLFIQWKIFRVLSTRPEEDLTTVPEGFELVEGTLNAGTDFDLKLRNDTGEEVDSVSFSARQGRRVILKDKPGRVDQMRNEMMLPFSVNESSKFRDGILLVQGKIVTKAGRRLAMNPHAFKVRGPLV